MIVSTKVHHWVKELLIKEYGDPVDATSENVVSLTIAPMIDIVPDKHRITRIEESKSLRIKIDPQLITRKYHCEGKRLYIPIESQRILNNSIRRIFMKDFEAYVKERHPYKAKGVKPNDYNSLAKQFCKEKGITINSKLYVYMSQQFGKEKISEASCIENYLAKKKASDLSEAFPNTN